MATDGQANQAQPSEKRAASLQTVAWAACDVELKPAVGMGEGGFLPTPDAAARGAYCLWLNRGGEDLLYHLQEHLCGLARAVFVRRLASAGT
ncbi:MAG: hypothetical protein JSV91_04865 [Phycisphaerales bacterium]|nr:MAG: hypothetical protein JSV91_04865 [Phycisphaerales bacterium]